MRRREERRGAIRGGVRGDVRQSGLEKESWCKELYSCHVSDVLRLGLRGFVLVQRDMSSHVFVLGFSRNVQGKRAPCVSGRLL